MLFSFPRNIQVLMKLLQDELRPSKELTKTIKIMRSCKDKYASMWFGVKTR